MRTKILTPILALATTITFAQNSTKTATLRVKKPKETIQEAEPEIQTRRYSVGETPFVVVEEQATFNNGDINSFRNWVQANLQYQPIAADSSKPARCFIQFAIDSKGNVCDIKILRTSGYAELDNEAIRVIGTSPQWAPAKQSGSKVKQLLSIPIEFK